MIKQGLQLKISQQLAMTPQLQQAIRLLQLPSIELCQEIQTAVENNPLLELEEEYHEIEVPSHQEIEQIDTSELMNNRDIPDESALDVSFSDLYSAGTPTGTHTDYHQNDEKPLYQGETHQTLYDYLKWQLDLTPFSEQEKTIATSIIQAINDKGYLTISIDEIIEEQNSKKITNKEVEAVLKRIQLFDPVGVGARSLQETLTIQINQFTPITPQISHAKLIITHYLNLLAQKDFKTLKKHLNIDDESLKSAISLIQNLFPYPGELINNQPPEYIIPDIVIKKIDHKWQVILNSNILPRLTINQHYASLEKSVNEKGGQFIRQALQEANWFIKSIEIRNQTLLKVSQFIVEHQQNFFEYGEEYMKPMILSDVAQAIEMHESTVSRVTTQKYLQCPRGVFELKYFFSSSISNDLGVHTSATAIKAQIKKIITGEPPQKPYSDNKIVTILTTQGMDVARRTVAKYRESMGILPSSQRKQL